MKRLSLSLFAAWSARKMSTMASTIDCARLLYQGPNPWILMSVSWCKDVLMVTCPR